MKPTSIRVRPCSSVVELGPLIASVLQSIETQFYADRKREFNRDRNALIKAIMRYGYECDYYGWELEEKFILSEIMEVLMSMREKKADIRYLPTYLEGAMKKRVGQKAEEIQQESKKITNQVGRAIKTVKVVDGVIRTSPIETMAAMWQELNRNRRKKAPAAPLQPSLL